MSTDLRANFDDWEQSDATLLSTDVRGDDYESVDIEAAADRATELLNIEADGKDAHVIPLFAKTEPRPTNEYVYYRPADGEIGWRDSRFGDPGTERFTDCERLAEYEIGHRLRFWLPSNLPDEPIGIDESVLPPAEITSQSPLDSAEKQQFFDELNGFVTAERTEEREANWAIYEETGLESAIASGSASGPFFHVTGAASGGGDATYSFQMAVDEEDDERRGGPPGRRGAVSGEFLHSRYGR
jgi:hypothetical protein